MRILFASVLIWCFSVSSGQEAGFFLKKKRVVKTKLAISTNALYPGENREVGIEVSLKNGKSKWAYHSPVPKGEPYKNQSWADFEVKISGAQLDNGHIIVPKDYRQITEKNVTITIVNKNDRSLKDSITLPISFCHAYTEDYNGQNGKTGNTPGTSSLYLLRDGYDGKNGGNGSNGGNGGNGGIVYIFIEKGAEEILDHLYINYFGGAAGNGGEPGQGGKGGKGTKTQEAGKDGVPGNSGLQGHTGREATAPLIYYLDVIP